ncbi:hypothetical protein J7W08_09115 [Methanococcoides orientis]|uniref:hypothetical protein n=1 Tax=Methanococcoides orientis TaxID=2822137 RepID=UPI001E4F96FE|nr:hypothetical protein [Methanococcoides orientis]UGV40245.1 hypothetical protein J7W08_09115 [Methanococcoides orientis]
MKIRDIRSKDISNTISVEGEVSTINNSQQIEIREFDNVYDPRSLILHLEGDLVDAVNVKDKIIATGVLKADFRSTSTTGDFVLEANSIEKIKEKELSADNKEVTVSSGDIEVIREIIDQLRLSSPSDKVLLEDVYRKASNLHIGRELADKCIAKLRRQGCAHLPDEEH